MVRQLFWMSTGAALGLYGRRKAIDAVDQHVPPRVRRVINRTVVHTVQGFLDDVAKAQAERSNAPQKQADPTDQRRNA